jgi:glutamate/aspartate transport system permease protein
LLDLSAQARQLVDYTAQTYESFIAVTIAYLLINMIVMSLMRIVEAKSRLPGYIGGK